MVTTDVDGQIWTLTQEVVSELGYELVDIELTGNRSQQLIRVYIEKPGGILLADCVAVSRELGKRLDEKDVIENSYRLEISSPGIERPLRKIQDYERYVGYRVRIRLKGGLKGKRKIAGKLDEVEVEENTVRIISKNGEKISFSLADIAKANLDVDWDMEFQDLGQKT
ncbi:MAG: ribosome maturation factor RimP [Nitrospinae bacterium]|nr:ribosome maturation factor RimP [Nitrospinota bacterium]